MRDIALARRLRTDGFTGIPFQLAIVVKVASSFPQLRPHYNPRSAAQGKDDAPKAALVAGFFRDVYI
jgi:hypothetical protein